MSNTETGRSGLFGKKPENFAAVPNPDLSVDTGSRHKREKFSPNQPRFAGVLPAAAPTPLGPVARALDNDVQANYIADMDTPSFEAARLDRLAALRLAASPPLTTPPTPPTATAAEVTALDTKWGIVKAWRAFVLDALPHWERDQRLFYDDKSAIGTRIIDGVNNINVEAMLEPLEVRQAMVALYPRIMNGEIFFGQGRAVLVNQGGNTESLQDLPLAQWGAHGLASTMACQVALDVLRAWAVHPVPLEPVKEEVWQLVKKQREGTALIPEEVKRVAATPLTGEEENKGAAWTNYGNEHDAVARWYPRRKFGGREAHLLQETLKRETLVEPGKGEGNYWENLTWKKSTNATRPITNLINDWPVIKKLAKDRGALGLTLGGFYDRAAKIQLTANALHDLVTSGVTPDNAVRLVVQEERFKYLDGDERRAAWSALYTETWKELMELTPALVKQEKVKNKATLRGLYATQKITKEELDALLPIIEAVPEVESFFQRTLSPEGQILDRGYSIFVAMAAFFESLPIISAFTGGFKPKDPSQSIDRAIVKYLGINPLSAEISAAGLLGYLRILSLAGNLSFETFMPAFLVANGIGIALTNATHFLNEKGWLPIFRTNLTFDEWPQEGNALGAILAPVILIPGLAATVFNRIKLSVTNKIRHRDNGEGKDVINRRRFLAGATGLAGLAATGGAVTAQERYQWAIQKKQRETDAFNALPKDQQEETTRREKAEKESPNYQNYKNPAEPLTVSPFDINSNVVKALKREIGPTWMFEPARKKELEGWFGRSFTEQEIVEFRQDPKARGKLIDLLQNLKNQGKITQGVVDFYR